MTVPQEINPMKGPQEFAVPTAGVTVYQESKTILPDTKVGLGYGGINLMDVGQAAAKVASEIYTSYKNEQFSDKEIMLKTEQKELNDRLEVFAYRNDWAGAEREKADHKKRVDNILGWDQDSTGGGVAAKRLNAFAKTIGADYAAKVEIGSMRNRDNVENEQVDLLGANFEAIVKRQTDPAERGKILDGQALFATAELKRLGIPNDAKGHPLINPDTLAGKSQVDRAHIYKLENMRIKALEDKGVYAAKDYEAGQKSMISAAYNTLAVAQQEAQEWPARAAALAEMRKAAVASGAGPSAEFGRDWVKLTSDYTGVENTVHATLSALLIQNGYNVEDFIDKKTHKLDTKAVVNELAGRLQGDGSKELLTMIADLSGKMETHRSSDEKRILGIMDVSGKASYDRQIQQNKNLTTSVENQFKVIDASNDSEIVRLQKKTQLLGELESLLIDSFNYLLPSKPTVGTAGKDGRMTSSEKDRNRFMASIPGLEFDSARNARGLISNMRFAKEPVFAQLAFQAAWEEFNKVKLLVFKDGDSGSAAKRLAANAADNETTSLRVRTGSVIAGQSNSTATQVTEAGQHKLSLVGASPDMAPEAGLKLLMENKAGGAPVTVDTWEYIATFPGSIEQAALNGDAVFNAQNNLFLSDLIGNTVAHVPVNGKAMTAAKSAAPKAVVETYTNVLVSADTNGVQINLPNLTALLVALPASQTEDVLANLKANKAYTNPASVLYRFNVDQLALAAKEYKGKPIEFAKDFHDRYTGPTGPALLELFAIDRAMKANPTAKELDTANLEQMEPAKQAEFSRANAFKGVVSGLVPKLEIIGATEERLVVSRLAASDISAPMVNVLHEEFLNALKEEVVFHQPLQEPNAILADPAALARITQKVQDSLSKRYIVQQDGMGARSFAPAPPTTASRDPAFVNPAFFTKAGASVNTGRHEDMVIGRSRSVDAFQNSPVDFMRQFTPNQGPQALAAFTADPIYSAVFSGVYKGILPVFPDTSKDESDTALFKAATHGTDNYSILIAQAVLNTYKFSKTDTREDTLAGVAAQAISIRKSVENPGSDSEMHVEFRNSTSHNGTGYTPKMTIVKNGTVVASMEPNASTVDAGVSRRISYTGMNQAKLQNLMDSDTRQYGSDLSDPLSGNEAIIAKWFMDNPDQDSVRIARKVVNAKANDGQDGFVANTVSWVKNTLSPNQSFLYTRKTTADGLQLLQKNGTTVPFITLRGPDEQRPDFVTQVQEQREAVRRAGLSDDEKAYEDSAAFWTGSRDTSKPQWSWGQYGEGVSTSSYLESNAPNPTPANRNAGSHTFSRHPVGPVANQPMESIDNMPYYGSANQPMDLKPDDGGKLSNLTSLPNTPMDLGQLGTTPTYTSNTDGPKVNEAPDLNPLHYYHFNLGGPKANTSMDVNPVYNTSGPMANTPIDATTYYFKSGGLHANTPMYIDPAYYYHFNIYGGPRQNAARPRHNRFK